MLKVQGPQARGMRTFISGKSRMHMLHVLCNTFIAIVTTPVGSLVSLIINVVPCFLTFLHFVAKISPYLGCRSIDSSSPHTVMHLLYKTLYILEVKINFEFKKGVGIAIKSKQTSS